MLRHRRRKEEAIMSTLEEFAALLKNERRTARRTLRELAEAAGKSIGYLSDVEQGRKPPPPVAVVIKIEKELGIRDGRLIKWLKKSEVYGRLSW